MWSAIVVLCLGLLFKQWVINSDSPIETDILKLLPTNKQDPVAAQAFDKITNNMSDQVVFVLSTCTSDTKEKSNLFMAAEQFSTTLNQSGYFKAVRSKVDPATQQAWASYYYEQRFNLLTKHQQGLLSDSPNTQVKTVVQAVYNPFSGVTGQELTNDPFLLFREYLQKLSASSSNFSLDNDYLVTQHDNKHYLLITAELASSPYSIQAQQSVPEIQQWQQSLSQTYNIDVNQTGVLFYADFGTRSAKSEISTIGLFSLLGIIALIFTVFRSSAPLMLALLSISIGLLVALAATTLIFGRVHLFSLVFGASLIGVSIDYAFHYLTDRLAAGKRWDSIKGLKHIFAAITLGLITSLIGYLGLLVAPFPGLQQLALFSAIGLASAYATVVAWYPILAKSPSADRKLPGQLFWRWWLTLWQNLWVKFGVPAIIIVISLLAMTKIQYNDDIHQLQAMPEQLKSQEKIIANVTGMQSSQQMLVVSADSDEQLLRSLEKLDDKLIQWQESSVINGYQSLHQYTQSEYRQRNNFTLIQSLYQTQAQDLADALQLSNVPTLDVTFTSNTLANYLESSVSEPTRFLYLGQFENKVSAVVLLKEVSDTLAIEQFVNNQSNIRYLNKAQEISTLFAQYRVKIMELLGIAVLIIASVLSVRYGPKKTVMILLPSLIACLAGLAVTVLIGSTLNLFNLLALILIIGIGIDYTLFFAEQARSQSTLLAITLSAMTTLLSFGLLSLSDTHAIHSFGITVLSGIFIAWLLAPLAISNHSRYANEKDSL
ncbi:MMPL family transporter [Vibrio sp. ZSDE26]|uniref:MMPL family transporter n=1 Tax=Vibrio amylolyticus TaxID=2847292 RepID=A0A9X1XJG6_9VIBR|nr:MMPL family transporter [Vibrio amylolyticus]